MKIVLTESQAKYIIDEMVLDLKPEEGNNEVQYEATLNILSKTDFTYTEGYFKGHKGTKYIVGDDKPLGEFRFGHKIGRAHV